MSLAQAIAQHLSPKAFRSGSAWRCRCPVHDSKGFTLALTDSPTGINVHCFRGCTHSSIIQYLTTNNLLDKSEISTKPLPIQNNKQRIERALKIWSETYDQTTIVDNYLKSRHINYPTPETIRFHPSLYHNETKSKCSAMVALVEHTNNGPVGIHCTYLAPYGKGKANLDPNKRFIGNVKGAAIQLAPATDTIAVCEGIESAMSYMEATDIPTWVALSTSGLKSLLLPDIVTHVIIAEDPDPPGIIAANKAAMRWLKEGRKVSIARPPQKQDFNDLAGHYVSTTGSHNRE